MGAAMGYLTRSANWQRKEQAEYQRHQDWLFEQRYTAARERARSILGDGYNSFIDALPDDVTSRQICEALEAIPDDPTDALESWVAAMGDTDRLLDSDNRPAIAAALTLERMACAAFMAQIEEKSK